MIGRPRSTHGWNPRIMSQGIPKTIHSLVTSGWKAESVRLNIIPGWWFNGGLEHLDYFFTYGECHNPNWLIFFRWLNHQPEIQCWITWVLGVHQCTSSHFFPKSYRQISHSMTVKSSSPHHQFFWISEEILIHVEFKPQFFVAFPWLLQVWLSRLPANSWDNPQVWVWASAGDCWQP